MERPPPSMKKLQKSRTAAPVPESLQKITFLRSRIVAHVRNKASENRGSYRGRFRYKKSDRLQVCVFRSILFFPPALSPTHAILPLGPAILDKGRAPSRLDPRGGANVPQVLADRSDPAASCAHSHRCGPRPYSSRYSFDVHAG